ncbi:MAG: D-2-hydroxyacid dehydrogenase [Oscillospiraceae bacterium]|nr:MAG: D-2-hydroxyacid dehydrogenase [Oscillospiraceae bacterium]
MQTLDHVLVLCPTKDRHRAWLEESLPGTVFTYSTPAEVTPEQLGEADAIFGNPKPEALVHATRLRLLQLNSAGSDAYVKPGVLPEGVLLCNATGSYGLGIAEHLLGMLLVLSKKMHRYRDQQRQSLWKPLGEVRPVWGSTVLIVGLGDIGGEFARRVKAMGATVIGVRRRGADKPEYVDELYQTEELDRLLPRADTVVLCLPNTPETRGILSRERIGRMKEGAILLNVGRGSAVDADALCDALDAGKLWGAGVDVTEPEPLPADSRMWQTENLLITPHVSGGYTLPETHDRIVRHAIENLTAYCEGRPLQTMVDPETGYRKLG